MPVHAEFFKHRDFRGSVETFNLNNSRYRWVKFGSRLRNEISSLRANAYGGNNGHLYAMTNRNFTGDYAALNMRNGSTSWWSYVGGALNDDIESALLINRSENEVVLSLKDLILDDFKSGIDQALSGTPVKRRGNPTIYGSFWPGHDSSRKFATIEQNLKVEIDWWPDYDARVRYDLYFYLNGSGKAQVYVAWTHVWVEGGIFSRRIFNELNPQLVAGANRLTEELQALISVLSLCTFRDVYLLPGKQPSNNFGDLGNTKDDTMLVLVQ